MPSEQLLRRLTALLHRRLELVEARHRLAHERLTLLAEHRRLLDDIASARSRRAS